MEGVVSGDWLQYTLSVAVPVPKPPNNPGLVTVILNVSISDANEWLSLGEDCIAVCEWVPQKIDCYIA